VVKVLVFPFLFQIVGHPVPFLSRNIFFFFFPSSVKLLLFENSHVRDGRSTFAKNLAHLVLPAA